MYYPYLLGSFLLIVLVSMSCGVVHEFVGECTSLSGIFENDKYMVVLFKK